MVNNVNNGERPSTKRFNCRREDEKNKRIFLDKANCVIVFIIVYLHGRVRWRYVTSICEWFEGSALVELPL